MSVCGGCKKDPGTLDLEGALWHSHCIKCEKCKKQLDLEAFSTLGGVPYCKTHLRLAIIANKRTNSATVSLSRVLFLQPQEPVAHSFSKDAGAVEASPTKRLEVLSCTNVNSAPAEVPTPAQPEAPVEVAGAKKPVGKLAGGAFANKLAGLIGGGPPPGVAGALKSALGSSAPAPGGGLAVASGVTTIADSDTSEKLAHPTKSRAKPKGRRPPTKKPVAEEDEVSATLSSYKQSAPSAAPDSAPMGGTWGLINMARSSSPPASAPPKATAPAPKAPTGLTSEDIDWEKLLEEAEMEGELPGADDKKQREEERRREEEEEARRRKRREEEEQRRRKRMEEEEKRRRDMEEAERRRKQMEEELKRKEEEEDEEEELFMQLLREEQEKLNLGKAGAEGGENLEKELQEEERKRADMERKMIEDREKREREEKEAKAKEEKERKEREERERREKLERDAREKKEREEREKEKRKQEEEREKEEREKREKERERKELEAREEKQKMIERRVREEKEKREREEMERKEKEKKEREAREREEMEREERTREEREARARREREERASKEAAQRHHEEREKIKAREAEEEILRLERELALVDEEQEKMLQQQEEELLASLLKEMEEEEEAGGEVAGGSEYDSEAEIEESLVAKDQTFVMQQLTSLAMEQDAQLEEAFASLDIPGLAKHMTSQGITLQSLLSITDEKVLDEQMISIGISQRGVRERIVKHILKIQQRGGIDGDVQFWDTTMYQLTQAQEKQLSALGAFILNKGQDLLTGEDPEGSMSGVVTLKDDNNHQGIGRSHFKLSFTFQLKQQKVST